MRAEWRYGLKSRYDRLREAGYLSDEDLGYILGVLPKTAAERRKRGLRKAVRVNDRPEYLYERPTAREDACGAR